MCCKSYSSPREMRATQSSLAERVVRAAEDALSLHGYASPIDVLLGIRWLDRSWSERWRQGRIDTLQEGLQVHPDRIAQAMQLFRDWAESKALRPHEAVYVARTPERRALRFTYDGDPSIEAQFRTHWMSPSLSDKQRERMIARSDAAPELVVIMPLNRDWKCHRCGKDGGMLVMEKPGPCCLRCAGLDDLEFLPRGDAQLTRRAKATSKRSAVVVRFSGARKRYERQGLLLEPLAIAEAGRL
jgi:hypothetical protein